MEWQMPRKVIGHIVSQVNRPDSAMPVPIDFTGQLFFDGEISAGFHCSFIAANQQWAKVSGTEGYLELEDFVLPFGLRIAVSSAKNKVSRERVRF